jgi:hypothetical protein
MKLRSRSMWAADVTDARVAEIVSKTIGIDTHNHIDVPLTAAEMPGPDIDLKGEMKRSGLSAICMTFATDYQRGDAYDRFLKGLASMDRQLERNAMKRSLTPADVRNSHKQRAGRDARGIETTVGNRGGCSNTKSIGAGNGITASRRHSCDQWQLRQLSSGA